MLALEQLYEKYKFDVYHYLLGLTHNSDVAEDLLSECFLVVARKLPFFRGESAAKTWLFGIARNCWLQRLKKQHRYVSLNDMVETYITDDVLRQVVDKQLCDRAFTLLRQYDDRTQKVVKMRINGYSYHEIAMQLQISEGSARVIDHRTKKHLKEQLLKEGYDNASD